MPASANFTVPKCSRENGRVEPVARAAPKPKNLGLCGSQTIRQNWPDGQSPARRTRWLANDGAHGVTHPTQTVCHLDNSKKIKCLESRHLDSYKEEVETKVKICGLTSVADAQAAAAAGADMIGLMFYEGSPRHITLPQAVEISRALSPFVLKVGVFVNPDEAQVLEAIAACGLNLLQFHGDETSEFCTQFGLMSMKALRVKDAASLAALEQYHTEAYLLDAYSKAGLGGTGEKFNWDLAVEAQKFGKPIFLAGGLTPENVAEAVRQVRPFAVDVSSGVESAPGRKDAAKVRAFIEAVRKA